MDDWMDGWMDGWMGEACLQRESEPDLRVRRR